MNQLIQHNALRVTALAGRRPDAASAKEHRFPLANTAVVRKELQHLFTEYKFTHLVCAAACGADLIALSVAADMGIAYHIILPFETTKFRKLSVTDRPGSWGELYDQLIEKAQKLGRLCILDCHIDDKKAFSKTTKAIIDQTKKLAGECLAFGIVVWEGHSRGKDDATYEFAALSQKEGLHKLEVLTL